MRCNSHDLSGRTSHCFEVNLRVLLHIFVLPLNLFVCCCFLWGGGVDGGLFCIINGGG